MDIQWRHESTHERPWAADHVKRVSFLVPEGPLTAERLSARLGEAGIDRHSWGLEQLTDLELVLLYDYVERVFRAACDGKVHVRPRPQLLELVPRGPVNQSGTSTT